MLLLLAAWLSAAVAGADMPPPPASVVQDNQRYYTLSVFQNNVQNSFDENFIDMEKAEIKEGLSDLMVGAELVQPLFPFPFYGHLVSELYITTHGFLSLSTRLHDFIYKTQYIAPLRVKLDPSRSNSSTISVLSLPDRFTVEWSNVSVMAIAEHPSGGSFTFQVTLRPNGDIVFVYIEVQSVLSVAALYDHEPVAGISDAFLLNDSELHLYNKINIENLLINTRTVAIFRALPTCVAQKSCADCARTRQNSTFACSWCESAGHCSDGADRKRQAWSDNQCHIANTTTCDDASGYGHHAEWRHSTDGDGGADALDAATSTVVSAVVSSVLALVLLGLLVGFLYLYGRYNETSRVGRYLKRVQHSYHQFGVAAKNTSLELGRKRAQLQAAAKNKQQQQHQMQPSSSTANEFVNPHPMMSTNNNVITAAM